MAGLFSDGCCRKNKKKLKEFGRTTSVFSLHSVLHQEAVHEKCLKTIDIMDMLKQNFIHASAFNQPEFLALLEEIESEYGKIFYHTNVRWFSY
jgi:hypothetical protein